MKTLMMIPKIILLGSLISLTACVDEDATTKDTLNLNGEKLELSVTPKSADAAVATNLSTIYLAFNKNISIVEASTNLGIVSQPTIKFHLNTKQLTDSNVLYIELDERLKANTTYTFFINNIRDLSTDEIESFAWEFTTIADTDSTAPSLVSTTPNDSATNVAYDLNKIELAFDENIKLASFKDLVISPAVAGATSIEGNKIIFTPDNSLKANENYRLTATNVSDLSGNILTTEVSVNFLTSVDSTFPTIPTLTLTSSSNTTSPSFSWNAAKDSSGIAYYKIKKGFTDDNISTFDTLDNSTLSYTDSGLDTNRTYYYQLKISDNSGNIVRSNVIKITTSTGPVADSTLPVAGTLSADGTPTTSAIPLKWSKGTDDTGVAKYQLKRTINHGASELVTTINSTPNTSTYRYTDKNVVSGKHYTYQLHAIDGAGNQGLSNELAVNTPDAGAAPIVVPVKKALTLTWTSPTRNSDDSCLVDLQGYTIDFKKTTSNYSVLDTVALDSTNLNCAIDTSNPDTRCGGAMVCSYKTQQLAAGTWFFKIKAANLQGTFSTDSNEVTSLIN